MAAKMFSQHSLPDFLTLHFLLPDPNNMFDWNPFHFYHVQKFAHPLNHATLGFNKVAPLLSSYFVDHDLPVFIFGFQLCSIWPWHCQFWQIKIDSFSWLCGLLSLTLLRDILLFGICLGAMQTQFELSSSNDPPSLLCCLSCWFLILLTQQPMCFLNSHFCADVSTCCSDNHISDKAAWKNHPTCCQNHDIKCYCISRVILLHSIWNHKMSIVWRLKFNLGM